MAVVKSIEDDLCGIMIDGFLPDINVLHNLAETMRKSYPLSYNADRFLYNHARKTTLSDNSMNLYFDKLRLLYLRYHCPMHHEENKASLDGRERELRCWQTFFSAGNNYYSLESNTRKLLNIHPTRGSPHKTDQSDAIAQILHDEYSNIRNQYPSRHYVQLLSIYKTTPEWLNCKKTECYNEWITASHFIIQPTASYISFDNFQNAWKILLMRYINKYSGNSR